MINSTISSAERIYNQFVLHDLLGKVVPGSLVLLAGALGYFGSSTDVFAIAAAISTPFWLISVGVAWMVGQAIQIGRCDWPPAYNDTNKRYWTRIAFYEAASPYEVYQLNRYRLVADATGNGARAAAVSFVIIAGAKASRAYVGAIVSTPLTILQVAILAVLFLALRRCFIINRSKQYDFIEASLARHPNESRPGLSRPPATGHSPRPADFS